MGDGACSWNGKFKSPEIYFQETSRAKWDDFDQRDDAVQDHESPLRSQ